MAQNDDNDNLKDFFSQDSDFDNMLEEKTKGWKDIQPESEIISNLTDMATDPKTISDRLINKIAQDSAKDSIRNVSAGLNSVNTGKLNEIQDSKPHEEFSNVKNVGESIVKDSIVNESTAKDKEAPTSAEVDAERKRDNEILAEQKAAKDRSDPDYSRNILAGKVERVAIRGIQKGPWANPQVVIETVSGEEALKNIGEEKISTVWRRMERAALACRGDVDKISIHIKTLQLAASNQQYLMHNLLEELKRVMREGSIEERARAESEYSRIYRERPRSTDDIDKERKAKKTKANGEVKEPKTKVEKLGAKELEGLDVLIQLCNRDYDRIMMAVKARGDVIKLSLKIAYIKDKLGIKE